MIQISLPREIKSLIEQYGTKVHGIGHRSLLEHTRFYQMPSGYERFFEFFHAPIWGGCFATNEVMIDADYLRPMKEDPGTYADEVWHELVHVAQRRDVGEKWFNFRYVLEFAFRFGKWKKISFEREAFSEQARFRKAAA